MFERFTTGARTTVVAAQDSARSLGHRHIGTEHFLLGLLRGTDEIPQRVLSVAGVSYERVIGDIERIERAALESVRDQDSAALRTIGIDLDAVRAAVEDSFGPGALDGPMPHGAGAQGRWWRRRRTSSPATAQTACPPRGHIPLTPRAKKVLELSLREALALKHDYIGTEHLLLGLLREGKGLGVRILRDEDVQLGDLREQILAELQRTA